MSQQAGMTDTLTGGTENSRIRRTILPILHDQNLVLIVLDRRKSAAD
jgi:hypothetical protein